MPAPTLLSRMRGRLARLRALSGRGFAHGWRLLTNSISALGRHRGTQLAASMAYYALLSIFPAAIVVAAAAGILLDDPEARKDAVTFLLAELPLSAEQGQEDIESLLDGVTSNSGTLGLIGLIGLLITASALISAARNSVNVIFGDEIRRGLLRGKGLDLLLVLGAGLLFVASFATTLVAGLGIASTGGLGALVAPALAAIVFAVLYRVLPPVRPPWSDLWPGVVFAAVGYELLKRGFALYLEGFADYSAVYGSLGAVIAFMFFVYLASVVFLIGAEMAALWPAVRAGEYDPDPDHGGEPFVERLQRTIRGLFTRKRIGDD
jgi:membrane protein